MPHRNLVVWIDSPPCAKFDTDGVRVIYQSGSAEFTHRSSRENFRQMCIDGLRGLNAWEDAQEEVVQPFRAGGAH